MEFNLEVKAAHTILSHQPARRERKRPILVADDWFSDIVSLIKEYVGDHMIAVVADETVARLYPGRIQELQDALPRVRVLTLKAGEQAKQLAVFELVQRFLLENELHGDDFLVSIGGGTISDLAGFVASTYHRGIQWISIPTTFIAQSDCAMGGKTAINLGTSKNYIGAYYWPNVIFVDLSFLKTLPEREFRCAIPEIAKMGIIGDEQLFRHVCAQCTAEAGADGIKPTIKETLIQAMGVKIEVIQRDPFQDDLRMVLQMGHTTAHALEAASNLHLPHGDAVGIGLAFESFLAEKYDLITPADRKAIIDLLENCGLPTALPNELHDRMLVDNMRHEKRNRGRAVSLVLPSTPGRAITDWPACHVKVKPDELWSALAAYRQAYG